MSASSNVFCLYVLLVKWNSLFLNPESGHKVMQGKAFVLFG
jgi:hypothetical protein